MTTQQLRRHSSKTSKSTTKSMAQHWLLIKVIQKMSIATKTQFHRNMKSKDIKKINTKKNKMEFL